MSHGRTRIGAVLTTLCIGAVGGSVLIAGPSAAEPDLDTVQERVDTLYREAERASERYNDARIERREAQERLSRVRAALRGQRAEVEAVRDRVAASVVASYQGDPLGAASQIVLADDPDDFIVQMTTFSEYTSRQAGLVDELGDKVEKLEEQEARADRLATRVTKAAQALATEKATIDEKAEAAERLLSRLKAEERERAEAERQRQARVSRDGARPSAGAAATAAPASGAAAAAVQYALSQVGDAYVYGAAGPSAFDCSGLTMMAWAAAGVSLPHSSGAQMSAGTSVSAGSLQPGDLVFYYSPVSHVGIYIGNGMIVHAANPSTGVATAPVMSMPFSGAVRPG